MTDLYQKADCPTVPNPYRGTVGQQEENGTPSGTPGGTESLKALADKVLSKSKVGHPVGQKPGQSKNCCPTPPDTVGQQKPTVPRPVPRQKSAKNAPVSSTPDPAPRTPDVNNCSQIPINESQARPGDDPWFDDMISMVIEQLNDAGCQYMDAAEEDRDRARMLEIEYTVAANDGDSARFWKALREWKAAWIKELH
jgi:hypothetical protein